MEITILLGSIREERKSHRLAFYLRDQLLNEGVNVSLIDLKDQPLPLFGTKLTPTQQIRVTTIGGMIKKAHGVIIVTPEYHSNVSAVTATFFEYFGLMLIDKVTAIATASATQFGGMHAANNLRISLLNLGAHVYPRKLLVPHVHAVFADDNQPLKEETVEQSTQFVRELLQYTHLLSETAIHEQFR